MNEPYTLRICIRHYTRLIKHNPQSTTNRQLPVLFKLGKKDKSVFSTGFVCHTGVCGPEETETALTVRMIVFG